MVVKVKRLREIVVNRLREVLGRYDGWKERLGGW